MTVVRNDQHGILVVRQIVLEPHDRIHVQVVRRLVEQQIVGLAEKGLGEQHADFLLGVQTAHFFVMQGLSDAQPAQQLRRVALGVPSVHLGEFLLQLAGPDSVLLREVGLGVQGVLLLHQRPKRLMAHEHRVEHRALIVFEVVLLEYRESFVRPEGDRSARGRHFAAEHLEEGRLPCAVGSDYAVAVARRELQIDILEQDPLAVLNFQV